MVLGLAMSSPGEAQTSRGAALPLRVGASKVDVTPSGSELPKNGFGILDRLYARAIVLDNSAAAAALGSRAVAGNAGYRVSQLGFIRERSRWRF